MKKILLFTIMALLTVVSAVAQTTTLSYQAVVRDASNKFVQDADIPVDVSIITGGSERYFESRTAHTNHNGVISFSIGGTGRVWPVAGHPTNDLSAVTGWADATITVTYHLSSGDVTVNSPVSAVPYALEVAPTAIPAQVQADWNESDNTTAAFIWNKPSFATVATTGSYNDLSDKPDAPGNAAIIIAKNNTAVDNGLFYVDQSTNQTINIDVPTTVAELTDAADYAKVAADNSFTGTNTVPSGFNIETTTVTNCGNVVVNACDLLTVFDSLSRRITALEDALDALMHAVPPTVTVSLSDMKSTSMKANAVANDNGIAIISYEFCISENSDMSSPTCFTSTVANYTFTGLDAYKTYYVTAKATNLAGSATSSVVSARTPAHAPTATLSSDLPEIPTGFQVTVNGLDFREPEEGTVQIFYKQGTDCSADEDGFTAWPVSGTLYTNDDYTQNLTGLDPNTDYCVMVKVSNEDSTTTYGPVNTTSGDDISLIITPPASLSLCEGSTVSGVFFAEPSLGDVEEYTYEWSDGTTTYNTNPVTMTFSTAGNKTITCTATNITDNFPLIATVEVNVASAGTAPSFSVCENMLVVDISNISTDVISFDWGDGTDLETPTSPWPTDPTWWRPWHAYAAPGGTYNIVATNESGCTATQTVSLGREVLTPCTGTAHAIGIYEGQGFEGANDGREFADENGIYAVTDYDGNVYPVVQIGSQCWMAENLRTSHSPSTGNLILLGLENPNNGINPSSRASFTSKMAVWASDDPSPGVGVILNSTASAYGYSQIVPRLGFLYNWCAAVDTFNTAYPEVSNAAQTSTGWKPVLNLVNGNRRGICPLGWHLPSDAEWEAMLVSAGVEKGTGTSATAGSGAGKLVTGCYWTESSAGDRPGNYNYGERNSSGFSAIPGGNFNHTQTDYRGITEWAYFWTSTQESDAKVGVRHAINYGYNGTRRRTDNKFLGASVRCVRDTE